LTLLIFRTDLSLYAFVGIIMLVGLVKKNGIMMVDFAIDAQRQGKPPLQAIHEACLVRFRPIMMTTMAALVEQRAKPGRRQPRENRERMREAGRGAD